MKKTTQEEAIKRLNVIIGHLGSVQKMVEKGAYCPNIIQQSAAVQSALKKVDEVLLRGHLEMCVKDAIKSGGGEKEIEELMEAFKKR